MIGRHLVLGLIQAGRRGRPQQPMLSLHSCPCATTPHSASSAFPFSPSRYRSSTTTSSGARTEVVMLARTETATLSEDSAAIVQQKRALRAKLRKELRAFPPSQRRHEDTTIQNIILGSPWFKSSTRLCAYISLEALQEVDTSKIVSDILSNMTTGHHTHLKEKLYVPRVEDKNSHMRMLSISNIEDLVANSMNILEPSPEDANGNEREDVMMASEPVDLFLLPGVAFDRCGRRLGRGGGYYDVFLKRYKEIALERKWKQPLLVALSYSLQITDDNVIPATQRDVLIDAVVSPSGIIRVSPEAVHRM